MKSKNILVIAGALIFIVVMYVWFFVYNKAHVDYAAEKPSFTGSAVIFLDRIATNQERFEAIYINTAVVLQGTVTEAGISSFVLDDAVVCALDSSFSGTIPAVGSTVKAKGRVVGAEDDILGNLICRVDQCMVLTD